MRAKARRAGQLTLKRYNGEAAWRHSITRTMTNHYQSRREFVAASGAAAWLGKDPDAFAAASGESVQYDVLTVQQAQDLDAMAAQIIPTDDLPGAR